MLAWIKNCCFVCGLRLYTGCLQLILGDEARGGGGISTVYLKGGWKTLGKFS